MRNSSATSRFSRPLAAASLAALLLGSPFALATDDFPGEAKGYQSTSYDLSQYESINLANGNLTFKVPLYTLTTNGGLSYEIALHYNHKPYAHRAVSCDIEGPPNPGRHGGSIPVADGVRNYGHGWDLRPPRLEMYADCGQRQGGCPTSPSGRNGPRTTLPSAWVDPAGTKHYLYSVEPWSSFPPPPPPPSSQWEDYYCDLEVVAAGGHCYTWDGSNLRVSLHLDDQDMPDGWVVEDPTGTRYVHTHEVPACEGDDDGECTNYYGDYHGGEIHIDVDHYYEDVSGFYVTSIERGPYTGRVASNVIEIGYCVEYDAQGNGTDLCGLGDHSRPWLVREIEVHSPNGRLVTFNYEPYTTSPPQGTGETFAVLKRIGIPAFNAVIGSQDPGAPETITLLYRERDPDYAPGADSTIGGATLCVREMAGQDTWEWARPHVLDLSGIQFPGWNSGTFVFGSRDPSEDFDTEIEGWLFQVRLPSGAQIGYDDSPLGFPTGMINRKKRNPVDPLEYNPWDVDCNNWDALGSENTLGIAKRTKIFNDASGRRLETTTFDTVRVCSGFGLSPTAHPPYYQRWKYPFLFALSEGAPLGDYLHPSRWYYLATVVESHSGLESTEAPRAEIHRFHPLSYEEFSVDYLERKADATGPCPVVARDPQWDDQPWSETFTDCYRVLRHEETTRQFKYPGRPYSVDERGGDLGLHITEVRSYTDAHSPSATASNAHGCYHASNCTEVRLSYQTDTYLNPTQAATSVTNALAGTELSSRVAGITYYGADEDNWLLSREKHRSVCQQIHGGPEPPASPITCTGTYREWKPGLQLVHLEKSDANNTGGCIVSNDCVTHLYYYDDYGNLTHDAVTGGYHPSDLPGCSSGTFTTHWTYEHGKPVGKELIGTSTGSLTLWKREVDPGTGLARYHVGGDGVGSAFLYDEVGRVTDIAPVTWDGAALGIQTASNGDPMRGVHVVYFPPSDDELLRHVVYDADYAFSEEPEVALNLTWTATYARSSYHFDGLGRETALLETMPDQTTRGRFSLSYLSSDNTPTRRVSEYVLAGDAPGESITLPDNVVWTETELDGLGRPVRTTLPDGTITSFSYWGDSRVRETRQVRTSATVSEDRWTDRFIDAFGRLRKLREEEETNSWFVSTYTYDHNDRLTNVNVGGQQRAFAYSEAGFLQQETHPELTGPVNHLGYDPLGNLCASTAGGVTTTFDYDQFGRLESKSLEGGAKSPNPQTASELSYGLTAWDRSYNKVVESTQHNRFAADDVQVTHSWGYDGPGGRVSERTTAISGLGLAGDHFHIGYEYDVWGNRSAVELPTWNQNGANCTTRSRTHLDSDWDGPWLERAWLSDAVSPAKSVLQYALYHPSGRPSRLALGTGVAFLREVEDPDGMARPSKISLDWGDENDPEWTTGDYAYDGSGNIYQIGARQYAYDGLNRLTLYRYLSQDHTFLYDPFGNMTTHDGVSLPVNAATNRLTIGSYDQRGNLEHIPVFTGQREKYLEFSGEDRVMKATDTGTVTRFAYDASGERVASWARRPDLGLQEARFFVRDEGGQVVSEWLYLGDGTFFDVTKDYLSAGGRTFAEHDRVNDPHRLHFYGTDHLGSTRIIVREGVGDDRIVDRLDFLPYGGLEDHAAIPETTHLFTGHERDLGETSSQLDYLHARYYSNTLGRFVSVDPVGGEVGSSQSWNRYSYVMNNPLNMVDPTGKYGKGSGWTEEQWERFQKTQQKAAERMEKRAERLEKKADRVEAKGKHEVDELRLNAHHLREGAKALRSDGSDGLVADALSKEEYARLPNATEFGAAIAMRGGPRIALNIDHSLWESTGFDAQRALGHESLHTAGLEDQFGEKYPVRAYKEGPAINQKAYLELIGTEKALINPDHIMDLVY